MEDPVRGHPRTRCLLRPPDPRYRSPHRSNGRRRRRFWRWVVCGVLVALLGLALVTARWYIWPPQAPVPPRVDAIVMLNGPGDRLHTALALSWAHRAPMIVISRGSPGWEHGRCAPRIPQVTVICFDPSPSTTRGEAEFAGRLAARYHWRTVAVVAVTPQDTVARLRVQRCLPATVYVVNAPLPRRQWPLQIAHEWGSTVKALLVQRSC